MNADELDEVARLERGKLATQQLLREQQARQAEERRAREREREEQIVVSEPQAPAPAVEPEPPKPKYSQEDEELIILEACAPVPGKKFLDIGAYHPTVFSNTRALYERGWSGVMIEPSPGPMLSLLKEYGSVESITLIQAAMNITGGLVSMHISDDAVSTSSDVEFEKWREHSREWRGRALVPGITWEQISLQFGGFGFVNIDAEGMSVNLFHRMLDLKLFPPVVCVEHESRLEEMSARATGVRYAMIYSNGTNAIFRRR